MCRWSALRRLKSCSRPPQPAWRLTRENICCSMAIKLLKPPTLPEFQSTATSHQPLLESLLHFPPVHHVPPRLQIIGADIFVFQVVGVLPNVVAHDGPVALHHGIVLIGRGDDVE